MTEIELKFTAEMETALEQNKKLCTCRESIHGTAGDTFKLSNGKKYKIIGIVKTTLKKAIEEYYQVEGFKTPESFFDFWIKAKDIKNLYEFSRTYGKKTAFLHFITPA